MYVQDLLELNVSHNICCDIVFIYELYTLVVPIVVHYVQFSPNSCKMGWSSPNTCSLCTKLIPSHSINDTWHCSFYKNVLMFLFWHVCGHTSLLA
jgi:hypothetical protein